MQKKVLSEQSLFYGDINMPKYWDIDRNKLTKDILQSTFKPNKFPFSKTWDMLNTYMIDFIGLDYDIELKNNMFIMFPSTNMYYLTNNQKDSLNFVQTITYEYI